MFEKKHYILVVQGIQTKAWEDLVASLRKRGAFSIYVAGSVSEAVSIIKNRPVDIVISDYDLPRDSLKFLRKVKILKPHIELIFLSENVNLSKAIEAMKEGAYDFYEFPVDRRLLMTVIDKAIEKQTLYFEKSELERKMREQFDFRNIIGRSKTIKNIINIVSSIAPKNVNILIITVEIVGIPTTGCRR